MADDGAKVKDDPDGVKSEQINIKIKDSNGQEFTFRVKASTKFEKIVTAYHQKTSTAPGTIRFMFDGNRINPNSTVSDQELEDNDVVEAFPEQVGGGSRRC